MSAAASATATNAAARDAMPAAAKVLAVLATGLPMIVARMSTTADQRPFGR
jgi:hypothetical protein